MAKKVLPKFAIFGAVGVDMSQAQTISQVTTVEFIDNVGIEVSWAGTTPVGTIVVQHSNDNTSWHDYDFGSPINVITDTGDHTININQQPFTYVRVIYNGVSGTGLLRALISGKEV